MEEAIATDELLKDKQLIVFTKIKKENTKKHTRLKKGFETGKVFVLQNENSASGVKFWLCDSR
jgi:carboxyl-terminal processing protease